MKTCRHCGERLGEHCFNEVECGMILQSQIADDAVQKALRRDEEAERHYHNEEYGEFLRNEHYEHIGFDPIAMGM